MGACGLATPAQGLFQMRQIAVERSRRQEQRIAAALPYVVFTAFIQVIPWGKQIRFWVHVPETFD